MPADPAAIAADAQRRYWGRVLAATLRMARDVDVAEEATADAFLLALQTWPERGVPDSVEAWLLTAARRRAVDRIRRLAGLRERLASLAVTTPGLAAPADATLDDPPVLDDELRLVVLCCHPALAPEAQVALTMRLGCGVPTAAIAAAFLIPTATMAARLTRAKQRIAASGEGIDLPDDVAVEERMPAVRRTVHLAYTMGHTAGSGAELRDDDLAAHALRLARALHRMRPDDSACTALLALVVLSEARAAGRFGPDGGQVLLADAERARWDHDAVAEGLALLDGVPLDRAGVLGRHAAIAAEHARAASFAATDWARIITHYDALLAADPSAHGGRRAVCGPVVPARPGGRALRPRRGARPRWARRLSVRPRRSGPAARAPGPGRGGRCRVAAGGGVRAHGRRADVVRDAGPTMRRCSGTHPSVA